MNKMEIKTILKNTKQMIKGLENNLKKFQIIKELSQSITDAKGERHKILTEDIKKIYHIVFKNLCSKRIATTFIYEDNIYYISNTGISKKSDNSYSINAENISRGDYYGYGDDKFAKQLCLVGLNQSHFLKVLSKQKKDIFKRFMKNINLLTRGENSSIKLKEGIKFSKYIGTDKDKQFKVNNEISLQELKIFRNLNDIELICKDFLLNKENQQHNWCNETITTNNQGLKDFILIEQLYTPTKRLLEIELRLRMKELENTQKFLEHIKLEFSADLMFNELKKTS